jgi:hypothetical protein
MGKTYRRNQGPKVRVKGKDFKNFKKSNKFKKWDVKPSHTLSPDSESEPIVDL